MYLLFERLSDEPPDNTIDELRHAVQAQVQRIVMSHVLYRDSSDSDESNRLGMPSVAEIARGSQGQLAFWAQRLRDLIVLFEPRLETSSVSLHATHKVNAPLQIVVEGKLREQAAREKIQFSIELGN